MTHDMDHSRISEVLGAYLDKELSEGDATRVRAHVERCRGCAEELAGLTALRVPVDGLNPGERDRLRRAVAGAVGAGRARVVELPEKPVPGTWARHASTVVGVAAAVVVLVAGAIVVPRLTGSSDDATGGGTDGAERAAPAADGPRPVFAAVAPTAAAAQNATVPAQDDSRAEESDTLGAEGAALGRAGPLSADRITAAALRRLGSRGRPFRSFARAYTAPFEVELQDAFVDDLASAAPDDLQPQVRECAAEQVADNDHILPAYGAHRRYRGRDVLVLGYVAATGAGEPAGGFLFVVWPKGSCDLPVTAVSGHIRR